MALIRGFARGPAMFAFVSKPSRSVANSEQKQTWSPQAARSDHARPLHGFEFARIPTIQRKATVSAPDDSLEREADDVADKVTRMVEPRPIGAAPSSIQRKCSACEDEDKKAIQRKPAGSAHAETSLDTGTAVRAAAQGGMPLSKELRSFFEPRFGHDFSHVRVHADGEAARAARAMQARAYTIDRDIVFGAGEYAPTTAHGKRLLAHELTHVVQQGAAAAGQGRDTKQVGAQTRSASGPFAGEPSSPAPHSSTVHIARKACLQGSSSCPATIVGADDQTSTGESELDKNEKKLKDAGETTWEFSDHFMRFAAIYNPKLVDVPTAWLVSKGSPWPAFSAECPPDLVDRDSKVFARATGQRDSKGVPDQCIFASAAEEAGAGTFLDDPTKEEIDGKSRDDWRHEATMIIAHELAHIPVRREVIDKVGKGQLTNEQGNVQAGTLNEAAGVLAELPLIYEFEKQKDPVFGKDVGFMQVLTKVQGGANPPGSSYTIQGLMQRACCTISCKEVTDRMDVLIKRASASWTKEQKQVIFKAFEQGSFCDGNASVTVPKPEPRNRA